MCLQSSLTVPVYSPHLLFLFPVQTCYSGWLRRLVLRLVGNTMSLWRKKSTSHTQAPAVFPLSSTLCVTHDGDAIRWLLFFIVLFIIVIWTLVSELLISRWTINSSQLQLYNAIPSSEQTCHTLVICVSEWVTVALHFKFWISTKVVSASGPNGRVNLSK